MLQRIDTQGAHLGQEFVIAILSHCGVGKGDDLQGISYGGRKR
jgi:hypothetical protein